MAWVGIFCLRRYTLLRVHRWRPWIKMGAWPRLDFLCSLEIHTFQRATPSTSDQGGSIAGVGIFILPEIHAIERASLATSDRAAIQECVKGPSRLQETARAAIRSHRVWKCSVGQYERARRRHRHALDKFGAHASHASMLDVGSASRGVALRAHEKDATRTRNHVNLDSPRAQVGDGSVSRGVALFPKVHRTSPLQGSTSVHAFDDRNKNEHTPSRAKTTAVTTDPR